MSLERSGSPIKKSYPEEVYLNGKWINPKDAFVSVFDRGFMFGDGVYEVTPFYAGDAFRMKDHLSRLKYSLAEIGMDYDVDPLEDLMKESLTRLGLGEKDAAVYIQITRGAAPRTHFIPENIEPTVLLYGFPVGMDGLEEREAEVLVSEDLRWHRCDIKSISLLANIMANDLSHTKKLWENLLIRNGYFTEGSHTSVFFVISGRIYTHPEGPCILSGITRKVILEICADLNLEVVDKPVHYDELVEVEEIFLTGTTTQVMKVSTMFKGENEIFRSRSNPITQRIQKAFRETTRNRV
ncbi:aminotransferase class IV [soil metagenome]